MNWKVITWYIGVSLLLVAALMTVSGIIACLTPGDQSRIPLLFSAFLTIVVGGYPILFVRRGRHKLTFQEGNSIVVGAWLMACLFGMLPFLFYGREFTPVNALFESISGFTTTGASILNDIEALPRGLQFWRIATAWVGGVGIVTLFLHRGPRALRRRPQHQLRQPDVPDLHRLDAGDVLLAEADGNGLVRRRHQRDVGLQHLRVLHPEHQHRLLRQSGPFYANPAAEVVLTFAMLAAGVHFGILFLAILKGRPKYIWKSETIKVFLSLVVLAIVIVTVDLMVNADYDSFGEALRDASFQVASISTTTGFATEDTTLWPPLSMSILIICSLICGCSGSTSGGIKIDRAILAAKGIYRKTVSPHQVQAVRVDGRMRSDELVNDAYSYIFCYLLIVVVFAAVNLSFGLDFTTGVTASVACIGNVGPGFGEVGSMSNFAAFPTVLKAAGMIEMLIGRLEIFPVLYLIRSIRAK